MFHVKQGLRFLLLVGFVGGSLVVVQHHWERTAKISYHPMHITEDHPFVRLDNFRVVDIFQQKKQWELLAIDAQSTEEDANIIILRNLELTFFPSSSASKPIRLLAQRGELNSTTREITVKGNVYLDNGQGYLLTTDSLMWDPSEKVLYTNDLVKIQGGGLEIEGRGFRSDASGQELKVQEKVRVRILPTS